MKTQYRRREETCILTEAEINFLYDYPQLRSICTLLDPDTAHEQVKRVIEYRNMKIKYPEKQIDPSRIGILINEIKNNYKRKGTPIGNPLRTKNDLW